MKKNIIWLVVLLLLVNLIVVDIFIFKMNNTMKEQDNVIERLKKNTGYHEEVKLKKGQLLCDGTYSGKDKSCPPNRNAIECMSDFSIKDDGTYSRQVTDVNTGQDMDYEEGDYEINKDVLLVKNKYNDKSYEIHQAKDCSYIEVDGMKYNKVSEK